MYMSCMLKELYMYQTCLSVVLYCLIAMFMYILYEVQYICIHDIIYMYMYIRI